MRWEPRWMVCLQTEARRWFTIPGSEGVVAPATGIPILPGAPFQSPYMRPTLERTGAAMWIMAAGCVHLRKKTSQLGRPV